MHLPSKYQYIIFTFKEITMNNQLLSFEWLLEMKYMIISGGLVFESCGNYLGLDVCVLIEFIWIKIITERERDMSVWGVQRWGALIPDYQKYQGPPVTSAEVARKIINFQRTFSNNQSSIRGDIFYKTLTKKERLVGSHHSG